MSAQLLAGRARVAMLWSNHVEALTYGRKAVSSGEPFAVVQGRIAVGITQIKTGDIAPGLRELYRARALCATLSDADLLLVCYINLACGLRLAGRLEECVKVNLEGYELAGILASGGGRGDLLLANAAEAEFTLGCWDRAHCLAGQIAERATDPVAVRAAHRILGRISIQRDPASAQQVLAAAADGAAAAHSRPASSVDTRVAQAELAVWTGDHTHARNLLISSWEAVCGTGEAAHCGHLLALLARTGCCPEAVLADLPEQQAYARQCQAESTDRAAAWQSATQRWTSLRRPFEAAYCGWRWACALLIQPRSTTGGVTRSEAQAVLATAARHAQRLGAHTLLSEIEALARLHRLPLAAPPAPAAAAPLGLTSREAEVLAWITAGWSNRQIGEKLFISPKTVSVHISNILRKLDVNSRYEAAALARRSRAVLGRDCGR